jgi:hypothetical protein
MEETTNNPDNPQKKRFGTEMIVALAAIMVSVMTLFVYIYQARIMQEQQHTSVWPYVEWTTTYYSEENQEFYISVINKGVGPALMKDSKLYLDDKLYSYGEYHEFMNDLLGQGKRDSLWIMYSVVDNRVMAPGEEVKIFHVKNWKESRIPQVDFKRIKYTLCYCSIYGDCWTTDGTISREGSCQ